MKCKIRFFFSFFFYNLQISKQKPSTSSESKVELTGIFKTSICKNNKETNLGKTDERTNESSFEKFESSINYFNQDFESSHSEIILYQMNLGIHWKIGIARDLCLQINIAYWMYNATKRVDQCFAELNNPLQWMNLVFHQCILPLVALIRCSSYEVQRSWD